MADEKAVMIFPFGKKVLEYSYPDERNLTVLLNVETRDILRRP